MGEPPWRQTLPQLTPPLCTVGWFAKIEVYVQVLHPICLIQQNRCNFWTNAQCRFQYLKNYPVFQHYTYYCHNIKSPIRKKVLLNTSFSYYAFFQKHASLRQAAENSQFSNWCCSQTRKILETTLSGMKDKTNILHWEVRVSQPDLTKMKNSRLNVHNFLRNK